VSQQRSRLLEIDALRGLAAIAVVLFHLTQRFVELFAPAQPPSLLVTHGYYGVNLFFIISGFVIFMTLDRTRRPMDFVVSRFSRLFPAYWCAIALTFTLTHALALPLKTVTLTQALANVFMVHGLFKVPHVDGVYWTLEIELLFYLFMFVLYRAGQLGRVAFFVGALLALRVLYVALARHAGIELSWTLAHLLILEYLPWFALGIAIFRIVHPAPGFGARQSLVLAAGAVATLAYADGPLLGLLALVLASTVWAAAAGRLPWLSHPVLVWLGAISYPLYLLHENIGWAVQLQLLRLGVNTDVTVLVALAVALALASALHRWVEQPALRAIRARYRRHEKPEPQPSAPA
jgi:peptidoglycan/LPS O-acetylase OafA/YrhL